MDIIPRVVQVPQLELFTNRLPNKPYCSDQLGFLLVRPVNTALGQRYIQHNAPPLIGWMVFDVDRPNSAMAWHDALLPPPAWIASNPRNGHCHIAYGLVAPIARTDAARQAPLRLAAAIEYAYLEALQADGGYVGLVTKNPLHPHWRVWTPESSNHGLYELAELAEYVTLPKKLPKKAEMQGLGRNISLFNSLRTWAYKAVRDYWRPDGVKAWHQAVLERAQALNQFPTPLPQSEIRATAKSVARWVWKNFSPTSLRNLIERTHSPELQAKRGRHKGAALREQGLQMLQKGYSVEQIIESIGVNRATVYRWLKLVNDNH